uniref:sensor domain-containing diguanylate cyclase n=1 Tax=Ningiella ruwaisensis TaxID=2364274 RepID=UPI0010A0601A|nr:diguanylate cyclase [Ningiella ruwaisensis]
MSLSFRISIVIGLIAIALSALVASINYHFQIKQAQHQGEQLVMQMAQNDAGTASIAAYLSDVELAKEIAQGLAANDLVARATVYSQTEQISLAGRSRFTSNAIDVVLFNPFDETEKIGMLRVEPDLDFIEQQASVSAYQTAFTLIGLSLLIAIIVGLFVSLKLTRPLRLLSNSFNSIDTQHPDKMQALDLRYYKRDEIGKLIRTTNKLIEALQDQFLSEKQLRETTEELQKRFRLLFEKATAGIALLTHSGEINIANPAFYEVFENDGSATNFIDFFDSKADVLSLLNTLDTDEHLTQLEEDFSLHINGSKRYVHCLFSKILDSRETDRQDSDHLIEVIIYDITERRKQELKARYEADHDSLTGLMNRRSGQASLTQLCAQSIDKHCCFALMMIDLDKFKPVNDTYGHDAGDVVLRVISARLQTRLQSEDAVFVRWGGDEFLLGIKVINNEALDLIAKHVLEDIQNDIRIDDNTKVVIGASIGIITYSPQQHQSDESLSIDNLINQADELMYTIKQQGRNRFVIEGSKSS